MSSHGAPLTIYVTYPGTAQTRFDRDYYVKRHLPLVMEAWERYGLQGVAAFFPAIAQSGTIAICKCLFRDEAAVAAAFASPQAPEVMADIPHFTDVAPARARAVPL